MIAQYETLTRTTNSITTVMDDIISIIEGIYVDVRLAIAINHYRPRPIIARPVSAADPQTKEMSGKQIVVIHKTV